MSDPAIVLNLVPDFTCDSENPPATENYSPPAGTSDYPPLANTSDPAAGYEVCDLNDSRMDIDMSFDDDAMNMEVNEVGGEISCTLNEFVAKDATEPAVGMKFGTVDELYEFYKNYAYRVGFPIRRRSSWKGKDDGVLRGVKFTCGREGSRKSGSKDQLEPQPTMKNGCKARLTAVTENYAYRVGFPIRRRSSWKGKDDGVLRGVKFTCGREGSRKSGSKDQLEPQPTMKNGCKARLTCD